MPATASPAPTASPVPALVSLLGRWNWRFPRPVARALRVAPVPRPAIETAGS